jgi:multisubunit Na+/H+ antiporter MnhE subunit
MRRALLALVLLTLVYAFVLGSFKPLDLAFGAMVSGALILATRAMTYWDEPQRVGILTRVIYFWPFAAATIRDIITGTIEVTLVTLNIKPLVSPGIVAVPIGERTPTGVAVSSQASTLIPGTYLVDVDYERGVMLIHSIDASDPEAVIEDHQRFYRRYQSKVFP